MTQCPSPKQLERLLEEQLDDAERSQMTQHVANCSACQLLLEQLTADTDSITTALSVDMARPSQAPATEPLEPFLTRLKNSSMFALLAARAGNRSWGRSAPVTSVQYIIPDIPGYEILDELGRGGMGVVYQARQVALNRLVALKMILAGPHARPRDLARFRQEAEAVAQLRHPNIVQIYDIGEANGLPYFALEFVEEGSLVQRLRGDLQPIAPAVRLIETIARAVDFAHRHHVVHRDLKPANILLASPLHARVGTDGEDEPAPVELGNGAEAWSDYGLPKITDFGLAKRMDENGKGTHSGEVVGTPSYMAPEQAAGTASQLGPATDVYALGAILYEMLTGRPPFKGATAVDTLVQVIHEEPVRPARLRPGLPLDLETICLKCLSKEPGRRYLSAAALADDLQRFRKGKPILARPVSLPERVWKHARRRPLVAVLLTGMILSVVLGFAGITWQWQEATWARDNALTQTQQAERAKDAEHKARRAAQMALYFSRIPQSQLQWRVNNVTGAVQSLVKCVPPADEEDWRGWEWHYLLGLFHSDLFTLYHDRAGAGGNAIYHPSGRVIASVVGGHPAEDDAHRGEVCFWDALTGAQVRTLAVPGTVLRLAYRPDGERLALTTTDGLVLILDTGTGKRIYYPHPHGHMVPGVAFNPTGEFLATASWDETVRICDAATGEIRRVFKEHKDRVQTVAFHLKGRLVASGDWAATVKVWDVATGKVTHNLVGHKSPVYGVDFSPDGKLLVSASSNGNVRIWDLETGKVVQSLTSRAGAVLGCRFSPDGRYVAYCGGDGTVRVWDVESGIERINFRGHTASAESVQFSPDGQRLVSSSPEEGAVRVWDLTRHPEHATFAKVRGRAGARVNVRDLTGRADKAVLSGTGPDLEALAFHADGKHLVSVAIGGHLQTWDATSGVLKAERSLQMCDELISPAVLATFNRGGTRLAGVALQDRRQVKIWDVATGKETLTLRGHTLPVLCVRFSADGRRLATCACDVDHARRAYEIKVWDAADGTCLTTLTGHGLLFTASFSPDGRWLALGGQEGTLLADWQRSARTISLRQAKNAAQYRNPVAAIAFSGDGRLLAAAGIEDRQLRIWELDNIDPAHGRLPRLAKTVTAPMFLCDLAFSPDGKRLAGVSRDAVKLWDVATGHDVLSLRGALQRHWDPAFNPRVAFSPDGKRLVASNWDESISLWDASIPADMVVPEYQAARRRAADARAVFYHLQEAEDCLAHNNLDAARFHFRRLGDVELPGPLQARKDQLVQKLAQ
jgi:WD40 repeat protein/serine/threonine protein kinase